MQTIRIRQGIFSLALVFAIVVGVYYSNPGYWQSLLEPIPPNAINQSDRQAFELSSIPSDAEKSATPEKLSQDGEAIIAKANEVLQKYDLTQVETTAEQRAALEARLSSIQEKIDSLENQLE